MLPKKVFLETNALFSLGPKFENVDFVRLAQIRDLLRFELLVAETSWNEYLRHRRKDLQDCLSRNRQNRSMLEKHGQDLEGCERTHKQIEHALSSLAEYYSSVAGSIGVVTVPVPPIDVNLLLNMSLANDPPFEDSQSESGEKTKEKGFRDAAIMFTMLESIRGQHDIMIITRDGLLKQGLKNRSEEYDTNPLIVGSISDAVKTIIDQVSLISKERLKKRSEQAMEFLLEHRDEIAASVQSVKELSEINLGQGPLAGVLSGREGKRLDIERVIALTFNDVDSAVWKDREDTTSRILFKANCTAKVLATPQSFPGYQYSTFEVGGEKNESKSSWWWGQTVKPSEHEVPVQLYGEATLTESGNDWKLNDIKLDTSVSEDWIRSRRQS